MMLKQNAFFRSPVMGSPTVPAHQLKVIIPGVQPDWMSLMLMVFGDSVEKNVLLILMTVLMSFFLDKDFPSTTIKSFLDLQLHKIQKVLNLRVFFNLSNSVKFFMFYMILLIFIHFTYDLSN
jgi:hypothetical protein